MKEIGASDFSCQECGGSKNIVLQFKDTIEIHSIASGKNKNMNGKNSLKFKDGDSLHKNSGSWNHRRYTVDKKKNLYQETIVDGKSGKIIHNCEEPLSEHQGHGSAKSEKKPE